MANLIVEITSGIELAIFSIECEVRKLLRKKVKYYEDEKLLGSHNLFCIDEAPDAMVEIVTFKYVDGEFIHKYVGIIYFYMQGSKIKYVNTVVKVNSKFPTTDYGIIRRYVPKLIDQLRSK